MKYSMLIFITFIAVSFMVGCDEYTVGHGEHFGIFSWDKVKDDAGAKKVVVPDMCEVIVEQRCFEPSKWVRVRCRKDCGKGSWKHWCWVKILNQCDLDELSCLLNSQSGWRIQYYTIPCDYNSCDPEWYYVEVGGFVIDIRNSLVLERVELQPCPPQ